MRDLVAEHVIGFGEAAETDYPIRRLSDGPHGYLLLGLTAGLVAFLAQAVIDTNFYAMRNPEKLGGVTVRREIAR